MEAHLVIFQGHLGFVCLYVAGALPGCCRSSSSDLCRTWQPSYLDELIPETQQTIRGRQLAGIVWWIPVEFWANVGEKIPDDLLKPLRDYTMVAVAAGHTAPFGISFVRSEELVPNLVLRDSDKTEYKALAKASPEAETLVAMMKPMMKNLLGQMGENLNFVFFPSRDSKGRALADPSSQREFSIVIKNVLGADQVFTWKLPLTSLSPPVYCPVGKERLNANWKYCSWHGVAVDSSKAATQASPVAPPAKP